MIKQSYLQYLNQLEEFYPLSVIAHLGPALMKWFQQGLTLVETIKAIECLRMNGKTLERFEFECPDAEFGAMIKSLKPSDFPDSLIT